MPLSLDELSLKYVTAHADTAATEAFANMDVYYDVTKGIEHYKALKEVDARTRFVDGDIPQKFTMAYIELNRIKPSDGQPLGSKALQHRLEMGMTILCMQSVLLMLARNDPAEACLARASCQ